MQTLWQTQNRDFKGDNKIGKRGEKKIADYIRSLTKTIKVTDLSNDKAAQKDDIDMEVESTVGKYTVEVKTDTMAHVTGNLPFEETSKGGVGCMRRTKADWMIFYLKATGVLYWIRPQKWREYVDKSHIPLKFIGEGGMGYLCKIEDLKKHGVIVKEDKY